MEYRIEVHTNGDVHTIMAASGTNLLDVLKDMGILLYTPCGGKGTCGKCSVRVDSDIAGPSEEERRLLGVKAGKGFRLACRLNIDSDMRVYVDDLREQASIITAGTRKRVVLDPLVRKRFVELSPPSLEDQRPDLERVLAVAGMSGTDNGTAIMDLAGRGVGTRLLKGLPDVLRRSGYRITLVEAGNNLISVEAEDTTPALYGTALDIGTTTVAAYLYDLSSGELLNVRSMMNPQRKFGADVISRIAYAKKSQQAADEMRKIIAEGINDLIKQLADEAGIDQGDIYAAVFSGNTTMLHFLAGFDASGIAVSPFIPVTCRAVHMSAAELGITVNDNGYCLILPCVSAYIGADTVSAVIASGMHDSSGISLLVDIGTNGEIVLGGRDGLMACSTAAGPAFEGANIRFGMGGVTGAVDSFTLPGFKYTVIGGTAAKGICGSGTVDAIAALLDAGAIDETGALAENSGAAGLPYEIRSRFTETDGMKSFVLVPAQETVGDEPITITQKDIREIQNAKAAVAAGIETLISTAGISYGDIEKVYLAGGFGSTIHIQSAARIGLLPRQLADRVEAIGNASGSGASECLLSRKVQVIAEEIAGRIRYIELSASRIFTEKYVENMLFG